MDTNQTSESVEVFTAPKPDPRRLNLSTYPVTSQIEARYADMDVNGHLNNLALESLHEDTRAQMNRRIFSDAYNSGRRLWRLVAAQNVVHFLAEAHWPATITTAAGIGRIGRTSLVASTALFIGDRCISTCDTTLVLLTGTEPTPIPDEQRGILQTVMLRSG